MDRILRTILHKPLQILFLLILPAAIGGAVVYVMPRQYQSTANLLALHSYDVLSATSVDATNLATPAETQVDVLTELLSTRSFELAVAQRAHLVTTLNAKALTSAQSRDDALATTVLQHSQAVALGYNLFSITFTNSNAQIAEQVVAAIISNYETVSNSIATEGQNLLTTYQAQLVQAQTTSQNASAAISAYTQAHSGEQQTTLQSDPQYQKLQVQAQQAQVNVQNLQSTITTLEQNIAAHGIGAASLFKVVDNPAANVNAVSRLKTLLLATGAGLIIGLLACILLVILAMSRDRAIYTVSDLRKVTIYPVVMEIPQLSSKTRSPIVNRGKPVELISHNGRSGKVSRSRIG